MCVCIFVIACIFITNLHDFDYPIDCYVNVLVGDIFLECCYVLWKHVEYIVWLCSWNIDGYIDVWLYL